MCETSGGAWRSIVRKSLVLLGIALSVLAIPTASRVLAGDADVASLFDSVKTAFRDRQFAKCVRVTADLLAETGRAQTEMLAAALPAAPTGWKIYEQDFAVHAGWSRYDFDPSSPEKVGKSEHETYARRYFAKEPAPHSTNLKLDLTVSSETPTFLRNAQDRVLHPSGRALQVSGHRASLDYSSETKYAKLIIELKATNAMLSV